MISKPIAFNFDEPCVQAFEELKKQLVTTLIVIALDWTLPFELMCDASDFAVGVVLGKGRIKCFMPSTMPAGR
ncbi:RNA-directed DNA polymerase-like protein [Gossypium australe]|uniref:RNA-directed DNA polymerase-like protein n=1 Tax=Gossypium australe TaxID=47621 RepID=A0A5B6X1H8_9ROSI|nr:RNA-directed DNA polymerase-like protein [Gossypium australe]